MSDYLIHHGIKGMRWGIRKYQNADGSLTSAGKQRYGGGSIQKAKFKENRHDRAARAAQRDADNLRKHGYTKEADAVQKVADIQRNKAAVKRAKNKGNASSFGNRFKKRVDQGMNRSARKSFEKQAEREDARKEAKFKEKASERAVKKVVDKTANNSDSVRSEKVRKYAARGLAVAGTALAAYGAYKAVKAYNKMKYEPYYDVIGNYIDPKFAGPRSARSMVGAELRRIRGQARYDSLGNYIESTKDYLKRANKYAPRPSRR